MKLLQTPKKKTLKRKLVGDMFVLSALLLVLLLMGMYLIGSFTGTKQRVAETLDFQLDVFERQILSYYENLAVMGVQLSDAMTGILEDYLVENDLAFAQLNDAQTHIAALQQRMIDPLRQKMRETDCTGVFVMLEAQINTTIEHAETSRTGLYLQRNSLDGADMRVLLYRGLSQIGKENDCMPHRKWRLEFDTDLFPNYAELKEEAVFPLRSSYRITDVAELPGTDQRVMLMTVPLLGEDGTFYGLCGFEISEGYFKHIFAQPSELSHAIFSLSKNGVQPAQMLSAGVLDAYYLEPSGDFSAQAFGSGLTEYAGSYIGMTRQVHICPDATRFAVSVLIPKQDYQRMLSRDTIRIILLIAAFSVIAAGLAVCFSQRYLKPLMQSIAQIRKKEYTNAYTSEIDDLFAFLAEQDRLREAELTQAHREKDDAVTEIQTKLEEASRELERLAYSRKEEIDPLDYENFKNGLESLTKKERDVLQLYIEGKTVKDIIAILGLQESTVRYHNKNIYSKLGVHSLKQLLRYATVWNSENKKEP